MEIKNLLFVFLLILSCRLHATTENVVVFFPEKDERTIFNSAFPKIQFSETYEKYFKKQIHYEQAYLIGHDLDQHEKIIIEYVSKNPKATVFMSIGIGRYIVDYTFERKNFFYKLCPLYFSHVTNQNELDRFLSDYVKRLEKLKKRVELKSSAKLNFIYLGGQIKPDFFDDKKGFCSAFISNDKVKPFYAMNVVNILSKNIPIIYSPLFTFSLYSFYRNHETLEDLTKNFFNMMIPHIN